MSLLRVMEKLDNFLEKVFAWLLALLMAGLVSVIFAQVIGRFFLNVSPPWFEELGRFFLIWVSFLASALIYRYNGHVGVSFFRKMFPTKIQRIIVFVNYFILLIFFSTLVYNGIKLCVLYTTRTADTMDISMSYIYSIFIICFGLMSLFTIEDMIRIIVDSKNVKQLSCEEVK